MTDTKLMHLAVEVVHQTACEMEHHPLGKYGWHDYGWQDRLNNWVHAVLTLILRIAHEHGVYVEVEHRSRHLYTLITPRGTIRLAEYSDSHPPENSIHITYRDCIALDRLNKVVDQIREMVTPNMEAPAASGRPNVVAVCKVAVTTPKALAGSLANASPTIQRTDL